MLKWIEQLRVWLGWIVIGPVRLYQRFISPLFPPSCRFEPTCSEFTIQAVRRYGLILGGIKAVFRIARCHPLMPGGYEPVDQAWPRVRPGWPFSKRDKS